ncbi:hypothetical protein [Ralstonia phage RpY2]|uniref:Uncharacterized protein n=1 Tax=Ralstonia phage RpY2 TaxID=2880950 RepID=A0AC61TNG5_9CAUD|nr:hypothetical protein [Ralstonia phage RpY2]WAX26363.1 hypothetical protein [Ralstonia phage p2137]
MIDWPLVGLLVLAALVLVGVCLTYLGRLIEEEVSDPFND